MNQFNWTYLADNGKRHHVGLLHSAKSGHLLVHCNSNIVLIDFSILHDATYSIFIDDQLCEISIEKKGEEYYYGFEINSKADTPLNRERKRIEKRHMIQSMAFLGSLVLVILVAIFGVTHWKGTTNMDKLSSNVKKMSRETKDRILAPSENGDVVSNYFFIVDGKSYTIETEFQSNNTTILDNGMPLEPGDEFVVAYVPNNPKVNKIDYNRPTDKQITIYKERTVAQYQQSQPTLDIEYCRCLVEIAYELNGVSGLADFFFQNTSPNENPKHNRDSFSRLTHSLPFQQKVADNCKR